MISHARTRSRVGGFCVGVVCYSLACLVGGGYDHKVAPRITLVITTFCHERHMDSDVRHDITTKVNNVTQTPKWFSMFRAMR